MFRPGAVGTAENPVGGLPRPPGDAISVVDFIDEHARKTALDQLKVAFGARAAGGTAGEVAGGLFGGLFERIAGARGAIGGAFASTFAGSATARQMGDGRFGAMGGTRGNAEVERAIARSRFGNQRQKIEKESLENLKGIRTLLNNLLGIVGDVTIEQVTL